MSPVGPPSWWQQAQATNLLTRGPEPWTSLWVPPELCGLKPHPTVPGHRARMGWVCASLWLLHKQMQHGGAPGTEKGTCGRRDLGKHVTYCTRVASPCLGTCNIAAINTRVCSKHATLQGTCVISTYELPTAFCTHVAPVSFYNYSILKAQGKSNMHSGLSACQCTMHMCSVCMHPARQYCSAHAGHLYAYAKFSARVAPACTGISNMRCILGRGRKCFSLLSSGDPGCARRQ